MMVTIDHITAIILPTLVSDVKYTDLTTEDAQCSLCLLAMVRFASVQDPPFLTL